VDLRLSLTQELFLFGGMSYVQARKETKPGSPQNINSSNVAEIPPLKTRLALRYDKGSILEKWKRSFPQLRIG
jgi:iron complex outermembrane receptor protein